MVGELDGVGVLNLAQDGDARAQKITRQLTEILTDVS